MKAAVYEGKENIVVKDVEKPSPQGGGLLVKVTACAICGTDIKTYHGINPKVKPSQIVGHEFVGKVEDFGEEVEGFKPMDRLTMATTISCGLCEMCREGLGNICDNRRAIGYDYPGAFAEYIAIPALAVRRGNVLKVPEEVTDKEATLTEPLADVINAQFICRIKPGDTVVVIGAGPIGCLHIEAARFFGATKLILTQRSQRRVELASKLDIDALIDVKKKDPVSEVLRITKGKGADVVIATVPDRQVQEQAIQMVRKNGILNLFASLPEKDSVIKVNTRLIHYGQISITGASDQTPYHAAIALQLLASRKINTKAIITSIYPLSEIENGFRVATEHSALKVLIKL